MYHNDLLSKYWGIHKMIEAISSSYYFLHIRKKVDSYINKCNICHKIKSLKHKSYKEIRTALTSIWPWALIAMNFIVKLLFLKKLLTKVFCNVILTIVNQLIKKVRFLPYKEALNAKELTCILFIKYNHTLRNFW